MNIAQCIAKQGQATIQHQHDTKSGQVIHAVNKCSIENIIAKYKQMGKHMHPLVQYVGRCAFCSSGRHMHCTMHVQLVPRGTSHTWHVCTVGRSARLQSFTAFGCTCAPAAACTGVGD
jgi:hypothetical protein